MSWCARKSLSDRLASIAAIMLIAGSANAANAGSETGGSPVAPAVPAPSQSDADMAASDDTTAAQSSPRPAPRTPARVRTGGSLQHRVDVLSKALQLDARQRTELLAILESQRQAVSKIWSDPALLPAERTPATRAVQERTADQIRGILSEQQRQRYNPPKPQGAAPPSPNVEEWMRKQTQARQQQ